MITLYDFDTKLPGRGWSPFSWRVRLALNIKGIEHRTEWIQYADIERRLRQLEIPPSQTLPDGTPRYTVPAIYDSSTGAKVADSYDIVKYLDEAYPNTPKILAEPEEEILQPAFRKDWIMAGEIVLPTGLLLGRISIAAMGGESQAKYQRSYEKSFGASYEGLLKDESLSKVHMRQVEEAYSRADAWLSRAERSHADSAGPWVLAERPTWPDIVLACSSVVLFVSAVGEEGEEWKTVSLWNDGRWGKLWMAVKPFSTLY